MRALFAASILIAGCLPVVAQYGGNHVSGYTNNHGTFVQPYYRSPANGTTLDNYSTRGNVNPYTGAYGTRSPY